MKALCLDKPGPIESLYLTDREEPTPKSDEIRVQVRAVGLNPVDYKIARTGHPAWQFPFILGLDVAGIIDSVGENVRELSPGQRVVYHGDLSKPGGFAQYAATNARAVSVIPEQLSFTDAAALPCAGYTAFQAIHKKLKVVSGKTILIHGGAGGVGGFALQLSRLANLKVFTTCSRRNFEYVMSLGADQAIDYNTEDVAAQIKAATGGRGGGLYSGYSRSRKRHSLTGNAAFWRCSSVLCRVSRFQQNYPLQVGFIYSRSSPGRRPFERRSPGSA